MLGKSRLCWGPWKPSPLADPTTLLLLLLPVLNLVTMATMSTTFQPPRDGLRREGEGRGELGEGGQWERAAHWHRETRGTIVLCSGWRFPDGFSLLSPFW